jgi:hypothetical protein
MTDPKVIGAMWQAFQAQPPAAGHRLDTTGETSAATIARVREGLAAGRFQLR